MTMTTDTIITAQRLKEGTVVFLGPARAWVDSFDAAIPMTRSDAQAALEWTRLPENQLEVVDAYAVQLAESEGAIVPLKIRERIRVGGPTIHYGPEKVSS